MGLQKKERDLYHWPRRLWRYHLIWNGTEWEVIDEREVLHGLLILLCMLACFVWMDGWID